MSFLTWPVKDPDEILDYVMDWTARIDDGDSIATSTWIVPAGIIETMNSFAATTATIWLSGGTIGVTYTLTNRITTVGGRTMDQSVKLKLRIK